MLSVFDQGPPPICPSPFNLAAYALRQAAITPNKPALEVIGGAQPDIWSYKRLRHCVLAIGTGLLASGLAPGDIILLRLGHSVDFPLSFLAAIAVGLVPVPTSAQLTAIETETLLKDLEPAAILHDPSVPCPTNIRCRVIALSELRQMCSLPVATFALGDPDHLAYGMYTSGTSGSPRAVEHAHRAIWARRMMRDGWHHLGDSDRLLHAGAFNWTYTLGTGLLDPWSCGATAVIPEKLGDIAGLPDLLAAHNITVFAAAPGVFRKMVTSADLPALPNLRHALSAGEKLAPNLHTQWQRATGRPIYEAFGMSECSTFISSCPQTTTPAESVGRPQTGRRVAIVDDKGPIDISKQGMIAVSRHDQGLMIGYHNAVEVMGNRLVGEWFLTGDQGRMAQSGDITYCGRSDDMMTAGGYKISPIEVETALQEHPDITDVAVTELEIKPDVRVIVAFYTAAASLDEPGLKHYAAARLARYKQPRLYVHIPALPMGANNKVLRQKLRDFYKATV